MSELGIVLRVAACASALCIPLAGSGQATALEQPTEIVIQPGDTLLGVSILHGVSVPDPVSRNYLADPDVLRVGQVLRITSKSQDLPTTSDPSSASTVEVREGETLSSIARAHGVAIDELACINRAQTTSLQKPAEALLAGKESSVLASVVGYNLETGERLLLGSTRAGRKLPRAIPDDVAVEQKSGCFLGVANDAAIVHAPRATYVLAVLTTGVQSDQAGNRLIGNVSRLVYRAWGA